MIVGLTQRVLTHNGQAYDSIDQAWYRYLEGHTLVFVCNRLDQDFQQLAQNIDCLIITGGDDSALRRTTELKLATEMLKLQKPIVGVCHGCFLLQDVLGGTVVDIDNHHNTSHNIIYQGQEYQVNSYHTICVKTPHEKATVLAVDADGNTEAWIDGNIAGVVWHPERMDKPWLPPEIQKLL